MERTIDVSTNLSTQVPPDTINVDITIQGTSKTREECTAKYNELLQTMKDSLEQNGLSSSILKTTGTRFQLTRLSNIKKKSGSVITLLIQLLKDLIFALSCPLKSNLSWVSLKKSGKHSVRVEMN